MNFLRTLAMMMLPALASAEDGALLYKTFCSACHGEDGVGPENNVNPPLAKSEWVTGSPDRAISAVMVGLSGPVEARGKLYNLIMPPQGAVLKDAQLAAILTHVRKSWSNKGGEVSPQRVAKIRAELAGRTLPFTAKELLKKYPIKYNQKWPRLKNLTSQVYQGKWEVMPDFSKLEAVSHEEESRNLVDVAHAPYDKEFGVVWEGDLEVSLEGDYNAMLDASDGAALYIDDKLVVAVEGVGRRGSERARINRFRMTKGDHRFRLEYFSNQGTPGLSLQIKGKTGVSWLSESRLEIQPADPPIPLVAPKGRAVMYRNFIEGAQPKSIGVGYDGGVNQAFSIDHLGLDLVWQGDFIDGGKHWTNRGQGFQKPAGDGVVQLLTKPAFAKLADDKAEWPERGETGLEANYAGYSLDGAGLPTFRYDVEGMRVTESASFSKQSGKRQLVRKITFSPGAKIPQDLHLALAIGPKVKAVNGGFLLDGKVTLAVTSDQSLVPLLREQSQLLVPLKLKEGTSNLTVTYTWN